MKQLCSIILGFLLLSTFVVTAYTDPIIFLEDAQIIGIGNITTVNITLNTAPDGLSGYNLTISISNSTIADIQSFAYPIWVSLNDTSSLPSSIVWIKAVDLNNQIKPGATNISLGTLTLISKELGETAINLSITRIDDDDGYPILATLHNATLQVLPNQPPYTPGNPVPSNGAIDVSINTDISWTGGDPDTGDTVTYDVYFGTASNPPKAISNQSGTTYDPGTMIYNTKYYWKIIPWDNDNASSSGPIWSFTTISEPSQPPSPPPATPENSKPTADAGGPYQGFVGEDIQFNGLGSFDSDGTIVSYKWEYGDGTNGTGNITTHSYSRKGTHTIILTVTDDDGAKDTDETSAIILQANNPPTHPTISGPAVGHKGTTYTYTAVSNDADNDTIQYIVDWGDTTTNTSKFLPNGTICEMNHSWTTAGIYLISIKAYDNYTESGVTYLIVLIDIQYCDDIGYLIDNDSDGTYDSFYCNETGNKTTVGQEDGKYLIDTNGDGTWEYTFDPTEGLVAIQIVEKKGTPGFEFIIILAALVTVIMVILGRRKH